MSKGIALITGAADRIGACIARTMAASGYNTIIHFNSSAQKANDVVADIRRKGGNADSVQADLLDRASRDSLIGKAADMFGPLDVLINSASIFLPDTLHDLDPQLWHDHFGIHAEAPIFLSRDFARQLPEGQKGNIINLIDQRVWALKPTFFSYTLSKSVLWSATRTAAQSLAPNIRVNAVGPGPTIKNIHQSEKQFQTEVSALPLKNGPALEEIANAVLFILNTPSLTGQMLALDGGEHLMWTSKGEKIGKT